MARLIVTGDDFGLCAEVNEAICLLYDRGLLQRASFMVNTEHFDASVQALARRPGLEVGIHLNLTDGRPVLPAAAVPTLVNGNGCFPGGRHWAVLGRILSGQIRPDEVGSEWRAQITKARRAGIELVDLNAHGELHLVPQLRRVVVDLLEEFGILRLRVVRSGWSARALPLWLCSRGLIREVQRRNLPVAFPDRVLGLRRGDARVKHHILRHLGRTGHGVTELVVHPALPNEYHRRWRYAGEEEVRALLSEEVRGKLTAARTGEGAGTRGSCEQVASSGARPVFPSLSLIVPTYREVENIPVLVSRVKAVARAHRLVVELLVVDDHSDDGTAEVVEALREGDWVKTVVRDGPRSLSGAVIEGLRRATHGVLLVMDADLSHPPEAIPRLVEALNEPGVDFVVGSRYAPGGSTDARWRASRRLNSFVARLLARPLMPARDPTSGFVALRRDQFLAAGHLNPIGYKIGLELFVKCGCRNLREVPIHFSERQRGTTKLGVRQRLEYLQHLCRLWVYRVRCRRRPASG